MILKALIFVFSLSLITTVMASGGECDGSCDHPEQSGGGAGALYPYACGVGIELALAVPILFVLKKINFNNK